MNKQCITHNNITYPSRSALARHLLSLKIHTKQHIADITRLTPSTVNGVYKHMVKSNEIIDYYPNFKLKQPKINKIINIGFDVEIFN